MMVCHPCSCGHCYKGSSFESVSSVAWTFSASLDLTAKNKFVWFQWRIRFGSHPNSREYAIALPAGIERKQEPLEWI